MSADWLERRWRELCGQVASLPPDWRAWAQSQLERGPVGLQLAQQHGFGAGEHLPAGEYDAQRPASERTAAGQFFTPSALADALVEQGLAAGAPLLGDVLDPACGAGELLCALYRRRRRAGHSSAAALRGLIGWDRDPHAAWGAVASLVAEVVADPEGEIPAAIAIRGGVDALEEPIEVDWVLMNPPYLEAKRMSALQPTLRKYLKGAIPDLEGAWDLYMAFLWRAVGWVRDGGRVSAVLPNKVCQGRYAAGFRERADLDLMALDDLSRMSPRPFPGTSVYPVLLCWGRTDAPGSVRTRRVQSVAELVSAPVVLAERSDFGRFAESPWFAPFPTWPALRRTLDGPRLGDVATVRTTCSFHRKGLRERFVTADKPASANAHPYIGGPSFTRTSEVGPFALNWAGWWIDFDDEALRELRNPLPSLAGTFLRPKLVLRQHARRLEAYVDRAGEYVTKDVYPVAWPEQGSLDALAAVLHSTVFTALYNTVYQGIVVGGETYHYLATFLRQIPVPDPTHPALVEAAEHAARGAEGWDAADRAVAVAYGIREDERQQMIEVHLRRVGAPTP